MKKLALCVLAYLISATSYKYVMAGESAVKNISNNTEEKIRKLYEQIDFGNRSVLDYAVFEKGYKGYLNLKSEGKLSTEKDILTVCDMSKSSKEYRLWVIDMRTLKVLINDYVAHGQGSGEEFATAFSNNLNSHQSSIGFYVTDATYTGSHGLSLRMHGMDKGYNNAAYNRDIVVHGARYVCDNFVAQEGRLGRSWGCPAVSEKIADKLNHTIKDGTCRFVYYPEKKYLQTTYRINKEPGDTKESIFIASANKKPVRIVYEYGPELQAAVDNTKWVKLPLL